MKVIMALCLFALSALSSEAHAKATKDSAVEALQIWERCVREKVALEIEIETEEARAPSGATTSDVPVLEKQTPRLKKELLRAKDLECAALYKQADDEMRRYFSGT